MVHPSNKIIAIAIVCIALVGSVAYVQLHPKVTPPPNGILTTIELPEVSVPIYATEDTTDSDGDGLKDWQEMIQGTEINNADTDGDGTKDGAEITAGRNPLKAGPDDKGVAATELKIDTTALYSSFVPKSLTDNVSKELFSAYIQARNSRSLADEAGDNLNTIASTIAQETLAKNQIIQRYDISSIGTFDDSDLDKGKEYGERFGSLYIAMLERIDQGTDDIGSIATEYQNFSKDITAIYTPESLSATQAAIGNSFYNIAIMFSIIAKYEEDPIRAALAIKNMREMVAQQPKLFISVANYFTRNGILFENQDIQRLWANI